MTSINIHAVSKTLGNNVVLNNINIQVDSGKFCVIVGPSGCGKTTLLRIVSGLESPDTGAIFMDETDITNTRPSSRKIAMVFQHYMLYPHMSVQKNIAYALKTSRLQQAEVDRRISQVVAFLEIENIQHLKPAQLSGGQRQRVAVARSLVRRPKVFLFDEPLSNLDAALRESTRHEIANLHRQLKNVTTFFVTHDELEAMVLADIMVVMSQGEIQQVGPPSEIYENPANKFVAQFVGRPKINLFPGVIVEDSHNQKHLRLTDHPQVEIPFPNQKEVAVNQNVDLGIRTQKSITSGPYKINLPIDYVEYLGHICYGYSRINGSARTISFMLDETANTRAGDIFTMGISPSDVLYFDTKTGSRIY